MASHSYYQLDVFSHRPGGGNPLGVVVGADDWSDAAMQAFAKWTDIVETTFLLRPTAAEASYRLRIFMPDKEIAFAGHPSIGSAHVALLSGFAQARDGILVQECDARLVCCRCASRVKEMHVVCSSRLPQRALCTPASRSAACWKAPWLV